MTIDDELTPRQNLSNAIMRMQIETVKVLCQRFPELADERYGEREDTLLGDAAVGGNLEVVRTLLDHGFYIDAVRLPEMSTPLSHAIGFEHDDIVELLLSRGANPNIGRTLIGALNRPPERRMKYARLLVEHGIDVNLVFDLYGNKNQQFTAIDWIRDKEMVDFLRANGARTLEELNVDKVKQNSVAPAKKPQDVSDEIVSYFKSNFGPVEKRAIIATVPSFDLPITIHAINADSNRNFITLFTSGLSARPMNVPDGMGDYAYAELFIQLPADWEYTNFNDKSRSWPVRWLRKMAQYPHVNKTWLGAPITIVANEDPPQPLAPGLAFTCLLLVAEASFQRSDGKQVRLYRMLPIHSDERMLEIHQGAAALMDAFDRCKVSFVVDINRPSVVA